MRYFQKKNSSNHLSFCNFWQAFFNFGRNLIYFWWTRFLIIKINVKKDWTWTQIGQGNYSFCNNYWFFTLSQCLWHSSLLKVIKNDKNGLIQLTTFKTQFILTWSIITSDWFNLCLAEHSQSEASIIKKKKSLQIWFLTFDEFFFFENTSPLGYYVEYTSSLHLYSKNSPPGCPWTNIYFFRRSFLSLSHSL